MAYTVIFENKNGASEETYSADTFEAAIELANNDRSAEGNISIRNEQNGIIVWQYSDDDALKAYLNYSDDEWNTITSGHHEKSDKPSVYFDIDGTLGKWYADGRGYAMEEILDPTNHYFRTIEPHKAMIDLAESLCYKGIDVCIISAADKNTIRDKWEWIEEHLPFVPKENICFSPLGADKSQFVKGNADISILIDDYNKNLEAWKGTAVKAINTVNSHQDRFAEIDLTRYEALLAQDTAELTEQEIIRQASTVHAAIKRTADRIEGMALDLGAEIARENTTNNKYSPEAAQKLYNIYKKAWIKENISDAEMTAMESRYENDDAAKDMTFSEYVEKEGFADGSIYYTFKEFCAKELASYEFAEKIEQYMFERGEYDFPESDTIRWISGTDNRHVVIENIHASIANDISPLVDYFNGELAELSEEDELIKVAESIKGSLEQIRAEQQNKVVGNEIIENNELFSDFKKLQKDEFLATHTDCSEADYNSAIEAIALKITENLPFMPDNSVGSKDDIVKQLNDDTPKALADYSQKIVSENYINDVIFLTPDTELDRVINSVEELSKYLKNELFDLSSLKAEISSCSAYGVTANEMCGLTIKIPLSEMQQTDLLTREYSPFVEWYKYCDSETSAHKAIREGNMWVKGELLLQKNIYLEKPELDVEFRLVDGTDASMVQRLVLNKDEKDALVAFANQYTEKAMGMTLNDAISAACEVGLEQAAKKHNLKYHSEEKGFTDAEGYNFIKDIGLDFTLFAKSEEAEKTYSLWLKADAIEELFNRVPEVVGGFAAGDFKHVLNNTDITFYAIASVEDDTGKLTLVQESSDYGFDTFRVPLTKDESNSVKEVVEGLEVLQSQKKEQSNDLNKAQPDKGISAEQKKHEDVER